MEQVVRVTRKRKEYLTTQQYITVWRESYNAELYCFQLLNTDQTEQVTCHHILFRFSVSRNTSSGVSPREGRISLTQQYITVWRESTAELYCFQLLNTDQTEQVVRVTRERKEYLTTQQYITVWRESYNAELYCFLLLNTDQTEQVVRVTRERKEYLTTQQYITVWRESYNAELYCFLLLNTDQTEQVVRVTRKRKEYLTTQQYITVWRESYNAELYCFQLLNTDQTEQVTCHHIRFQFSVPRNRSFFTNTT
ncbi:hypothetical protein J6590_009499 [Homalodisca vitripennis]|nr:hypothetical protein J6590_009499 [Homalodisca vitripennis]